ncbi:MAG: DEAD/DEAH box helicase family protein, partial [Gammaproteobacteria bacterium]|nr:DEAD/DEAH box helicase family protein [Gammaproteobacteria bacterium]
MGLKSLNFHEEYRTGESNLVDDFYLPCLQESTHYDRAVGYFRSSVYLLAGPALLDYAKRGGEIRLICSPSFTEDDIDAINKGYKSHSDYINEAIDHEIESILLDKSITKNTELLATLITIGTLQVKIAYMEGAQGIYHEKLGVFCDENGDCVSFKGSVNETWSGWHERGNYETIDVFCEWLVGRDNRQVQRNKKYFHNLWNGLVSDLEVKPFPEVGIEKLKSISRNSLDDFDPEELTDYFTIGNDYTKKHGLVNAHTESTRTLLPHQAKALATWKRLGKRGVLEHATGSGKTFTALMAIKDHLKNGGVALVLVPDRLLHKQWYSEICTELSDATVLKAGDNNNKWRINKRLNHFTKPGNDLGKRIVLATMATARLDEFRNMICGGDHLMVIADEVHEIGSVENSKALSIESGPRLGLSATPRRYGDPIGTDKIFKYFGEIVPPPFTLQDAIDSGRLVEYEYHPEPIRLTPDESDAWAE